MLEQRIWFAMSRRAEGFYVLVRIIIWPINFWEIHYFDDNLSFPNLQHDYYYDQMRRSSQ